MSDNLHRLPKRGPTAAEEDQFVHRTLSEPRFARYGWVSPPLPGESGWSVTLDDLTQAEAMAALQAATRKVLAMRRRRAGSGEQDR